VLDGTWGFASAVDLTQAAALRAAAEAVAVAKVAAAINTERIELADEPSYGDVSWVSAYEVDPFEVSVADKAALLAGWSSALLGHDRIDHADTSLFQVRECKFYADGATTALQQRVRIYPQVTAVAVDPGGRFETMRTLAPPAGRGLEYLGAAPGPAPGPGISPPSWRRCPSCWPGSWPPPASRPAGTTWSSTPATCG
jgi:TldD protein